MSETFGQTKTTLFHNPAVFDCFPAAVPGLIDFDSYWPAAVLRLRL